MGVRGNLRRGRERERGVLHRRGVRSDLAAALRDVDFIIEAVPERIDVKLAIFAEIERLAKASAVIATNTSALSVTELAGSLANPSRVAGMHFFNPVHKMKLIEIVQALESSPATVDSIQQVAGRMGKETVGSSPRGSTPASATRRSTC